MKEIFQLRHATIRLIFAGLLRQPRHGIVTTLRREPSPDGGEPREKNCLALLQRRRRRPAPGGKGKARVNGFSSPGRGGGSREAPQRPALPPPSARESALRRQPARHGGKGKARVNGGGGGFAAPPREPSARDSALAAANPRGKGKAKASSSSPFSGGGPLQRDGSASAKRKKKKPMAVADFDQECDGVEARRQQIVAAARECDESKSAAGLFCCCSMAVVGWLWP
jgi:hypothetical protein